MIRFDQILVARPRGELESSLSTAVGIANYGTPTITWPFNEVEALLAKIELEPEGNDARRSPGNEPPWKESHRYVRVAWWTDYLGQRHVRITATAGQELDDGPALLRVYPDAGFTVGGDLPARLLVVCPCGVVGTPDEIAWMGPECGPCHDRRVSGVLPPRPWDVPTREFRIDHRMEPLLPIFAPDGSTLLIDGVGGQFEWNLATGQQGPFQHPAGRLLAWSHDGSRLAVAREGRLHILKADTLQAERSFTFTDLDNSRITFSPSGRYVLADEVFHPAYPEGSLQVWDLHAPRTEPSLDVSGMLVWALSPDERTLYLAEHDDDVRAFPLATGEGPRRLITPNPHAEDQEDPVDAVDVRSLLPTPDGRGLIINAEGLVQILDMETGGIVRQCHLPAFACPAVPTQLVADGRVLLVTGEPRRRLNFVTLPELTDAVTLTALEGPKAWYCARSDHWLAVADFLRVRLIPWPPLLEWYLREVAR
jgi:hypothetical protein